MRKAVISTLIPLVFLCFAVGLADEGRVHESPLSLSARWSATAPPAVLEVTVPDLTGTPKGEGLTGGTFRCSLDLRAPKSSTSTGLPILLTWSYRSAPSEGGRWTEIHVQLDPDIFARGETRWTINYMVFGPKEDQPAKLIGSRLWQFDDLPSGAFRAQREGVSWKPAKSLWRVSFAPGEG